MVSEYNKELCECGAHFEYAGPLWTGSLFESSLVKKMVGRNSFTEEQRFLDSLYEESKMDIVGFYDLHECSRLLKINPPRIEDILTKAKGVRSHCNSHGIKTKMKRDEFFELIAKTTEKFKKM